MPDTTPAADSAAAPRRAWARLRLRRDLPLLVLAFGLIWLVLIPPFQLPDEPEHLFRSYVLSEGRVFGWHYAPDERGMMDTGYRLPADFTMAMMATRTYDVRWHADVPFRTSGWREAWDYRVNDGPPLFQGFSNTCIYPPSAYPLGIPAWWALRAVNARVLVAGLLQRLLPLLATVACLAWVLRRLPLLRQPLALVLLAPISVQQAISPGADLVVNIGCLLFVTELIRILTIGGRRRVSWPQILLLSVTACFFVASKLVYVPVGLMALSLTPRRFGSIPRWLAGQALIIALPLVLLIVWSVALSGHPTTMTEIVADNRSQYSAVYWLLLGAKNMAYNLSQWEFYESWYGRLGWLDTSAPKTVVVAYLAAVLAAIVCQPARRRTSLPLLHAAWWFVCCVAMIGLIHLASVGYFNNTLMIQVRYYLPLVLPLLFVLYQVRAHFGWGLRRRLHDRHLLGIALAGLIIMTVVLTQRYYY